MNEEKLSSILKSLEVTPPEKLRAAIYLHQLIKAGNKLRKLANEPILCYLRTALTSNNLLNELAKVLDFYLEIPIYFHAKNCASVYKDYFNKEFFGKNFIDNRNRFLSKNKIAAYALDTLTDHFLNNIEECCRRINIDIDKIRKLFTDVYPNLKFHELKEIKSTGSDFHKGGKQVLILSFRTDDPKDFKLVYKPSDIEIDYRLVGVSSAIKDIDNAFMERSLIELINDKIDPNLHIKMRTLHILPINPTSRYSEVELSKGAINKSYGYIEYLEYDKPINKEKKEIEKIAEKFYRSIGQWAAIASIFSFTDIHIENIIVNRHDPALIDFEISLIKLVENICADTKMIMNKAGGVSSFETNSRPYGLIISESGEINADNVDKREMGKNRLYELTNSESKIIEIDWKNLIEGVDTGLEILRMVVLDKSGEFAAWWGGLKNVLVRYPPYSTIQFKTELYSTYRFGDQQLESLEEAIGKVIDRNYGQYKDPKADPPDYIIWDRDIVLDDLKNLDVPVFYNRIGTPDLLDSKGKKIILKGQSRETFFNSPPIARIESERINALKSDEDFNRLRTIFINQLLEEYKKLERIV